MYVYQRRWRNVGRPRGKYSPEEGGRPKKDMGGSSREEFTMSPFALDIAMRRHEVGVCHAVRQHDMQYENLLYLLLIPLSPSF